MERIEEFTQDGKDFVYIDLSGLKGNDEFLEFSKGIESVIAKYPKKSVYTITNIENVRFDSNSKELIAQYVKNNEPYVKYGMVIGLDGIKKIFVNVVMKLSGRTNLNFAFTKEGAIERLLQQE